MNAVAYAIVNSDGEVIVCRLTKSVAEAMVRLYYPGSRVVPLVFAQEEPEESQES